MEPRRRLSVLRCLARSYGLLCGNPAVFLRAATVPFLLSLAIGLGLGRLVPVAAQGPEGQAGTAITLLAVLGTLPLLLFLVTWTRYALLGAAPRLLPRIAGYHGRVLLYGLALGIAGAVTFLVLSTALIAVGSLLTLALPAGFSDDAVARAFGAWSGILAGIITLYLFCRLALLLPAAAVARDIAVKTAWSTTRRQGLRWLLGVVLALVPVMALALLVELLLTAWAIGGDGSRGLLAPTGLAAQALQMALQYIMTGALVGFIAFAFEATRQEAKGEEPEP